MHGREFWAKYILRVAHMFGVIALGGAIVFDFLYPCETFGGSRGSPIFNAIFGVIIIISGFINTYLLQPKQKMGEKAKFWIGLMHLKLVTVILFVTPIFTLILTQFSEDGFRIGQTIKFVFVIFWIAVSSYLRFYREYWAESNRKKQQVKIENWTEVVDRQQQIS